MKKLFILAIGIVSLVFTSCETETIIQERLVEVEVIRTETEIVHVYNAGSITLTLASQDSIQSGSQMVKLFEVKINGFNQYSAYHLEADFETNSGEDLSEFMSQVVVQEVNGKLATSTFDHNDFWDEDFRMRYRFQNEGRYYFDGSEHVIEVYGNMADFNQSEQIFLDQIELELEQEDGYVEHYSELDTGNQGKTFFLVQ